MNNFRGIGGWRYRLLLRPIPFWFACALPFLAIWAQGGHMDWWYALTVVAVLGIAAGWAADKAEAWSRPRGAKDMGNQR